MQRTHSLATFWTNNDVAHHLVVNSNRLAGYIYIANSSKIHYYNLLYTTVSLFNLKHDNRLDDSPKSRTLPICQAQVIPHFPSSSMRHDHSCCSLADRAICPMAPLNASDIGSRTLVNVEGACHILSYVSAGSAHRNCPENVK